MITSGADTRRDVLSTGKSPEFWNHTPHSGFLGMHPRNSRSAGIKVRNSQEKFRMNAKIPDFAWNSGLFRPKMILFLQLDAVCVRQSSFQRPCFFFVSDGRLIEGLTILKQTRFWQVDCKLFPKQDTSFLRVECGRLLLARLIYELIDSRWYLLYI